MVNCRRVRDARLSNCTAFQQEKWPLITEFQSTRRSLVIMLATVAQNRTAQGGRKMIVRSFLMKGWDDECKCC